ncbi:diacylglycerol kinase family protein [Sphingomonas sp.]|uniref:diacylglycerol kinase family protein n=1 Tax=Sphingomonas sp. TaxID=28214 RepID=UPI0025DF0375|nr:diacylglycerol kinase family protein [Sphingomonas sp.]
MSRRFNLTDRLNSFRFALLGLRYLVASEHNARLHLLATIAVIALGLLFGVSADEWRWLILSIALVWLAEAFNTALERLGNAVSLDHDPNIGRAKDVSATAVLIASIAAAAIGLLVFGPHFVGWLTK